jgi:hypothetical protein
VEAEKAAQDRVGRVVEAWRLHCNNTLQEKHESGTSTTSVPKAQWKKQRASKTSLMQQTRVLTARTWIVTIRDPMGKTCDIMATGKIYANSLTFRHVWKSG